MSRGCGSLPPLFCCCAVAVVCSLTPSRACDVSVGVDRFYATPALDAQTRPWFGWQLSSDCTGVQSAYRIVVTAALTRELAWDSGTVASNSSDNVACAVDLAPATAYDVRVTATFGAESYDSAAVPFATGADTSLLESATAMWHHNRSAMFVLFRRVVEVRADMPTFLAITAKPSPDRQQAHGVNASKLLSAYKLWINGEPVGTGPGRKIGGGIAVDTYNISALVPAKAATTAIVAVEASYIPLHDDFDDNDDDAGVLFAVLHNGNGSLYTSLSDDNSSSWQCFDAAAAFNPQLGPNGVGAGTRYYVQPLEFLDAAKYPHRWRTTTTTSSATGTQWTAPLTLPISAFGQPLLPRHAPPVVLDSVAAMTITPLPSAEQASTSFRYVVDFGRNFQGHVNVSFAAPSEAGRVVTVRLGEQLNGDGSVRYNMLTGNVYEFNWTLANVSAGTLQTFVPHEYCVFRYAEVVNAPEEPSASRIGGWSVHYPLRVANSEVSTATTFDSSNETLNAVWNLAQYTLEATALDVNTDSNTRQRDVCTLDAALQTLYQGAAFPTTSFHHRRRVVQYMFEPLSYVNIWTEFLVAPVAALASFAYDYDTNEVLATVWQANQGSNITNNSDAAWTSGASPLVPQEFPFFSLGVRDRLRRVAVVVAAAYCCHCLDCPLT